MTTSNAPLAHKDELHLPTLSWGWVIRRSVLWVFILTVAIVSACGLYAVASPSSDTPVARPAEAPAPVKT